MRICDECNYGSYQGRCVICGGPGVSDAYYCKECTIQEKDVSALTQDRLPVVVIVELSVVPFIAFSSARRVPQDCEFGKL